MQAGRSRRNPMVPEDEEGLPAPRELPLLRIFEMLNRNEIGGWIALDYEYDLGATHEPRLTITIVPQTPQPPAYRRLISAKLTFLGEKGGYNRRKSGAPLTAAALQKLRRAVSMKKAPIASSAYVKFVYD
eukprot:Hpha_TRINITY_DN13657_c0_g1::TRINITY_DN13657_c0_g1_i1::g.122550::m.122550